MAQLPAQVFVTFQLVTLLLDPLRELLVLAAPGIVFLEGTTEQAAAQRAPRYQPEPVMTAGALATPSRG